jgi:hypothetical protein
VESERGSGPGPCARAPRCRSDRAGDRARLRRPRVHARSHHPGPDGADLLDDAPGAARGPGAVLVESGWREHAACRDRPHWLWFAAGREDATAGWVARRVCHGCPVRDWCAGEALRLLADPDLRLVGTWAGVRVDGRRVAVVAARERTATSAQRPSAGAAPPSVCDPIERLLTVQRHRGCGAVTRVVRAQRRAATRPSSGGPPGWDGCSRFRADHRRVACRRGR